MRLLGHGIVPAFSLGTVQPKGSREHFQVEFFDVENVFVLESGIGPQHGDVSLTCQLILFIVVFDHGPDNALNVVKWGVPDVQFFEEGLEVVVN
jgi:hypothetical protein